METTATNETVTSLLQELGIEASHNSKSLAALAAVDSRHLRDLKLNFTTTIASNHLSRKEAYMIALCIAVTERHKVLTDAFERLACREGATSEEIAEGHACASVMAMNNMFYRFRHYMHDVEFYNKQPAGLRMSVMMNPVMGKGLFELISVVLSALNGCERCTAAHDHSVKSHGADEYRIYDAVRLGTVIKSLCVVI